MLTSIVGINWGDEGKGRMVDLLSSDYDVVCRYQGGNNAGHTVINERGKFILNLLPSGILRENVACVMGPGMVVDIRHLAGEMRRLREAGVKISPENLKISDRAVVTMPYNVAQDCLEEERLADKKFGSTKRGIAPVYADKYLKKAFRIGELKEWDRLKKRVPDIVDWKNLTLQGAYGAEGTSVEEILHYFEQFGLPLSDYITDTGLYLSEAHRQGKKILFEAQLGALRDIDFGIYPYTSSSNTIAAYAPIGAGVPNLKLDRTIGIMKAYSTCVGRRTVHRRIFRGKGAYAARGGRRIRRRDGSAEKGRPVRRGRFPLRDPHAGRGRDRAHETRRFVGVQGIGDLHRLSVGRQKTDRVSFPRPARFLRAGFRNGAGLEPRYFRLPQKGRSSQRGARLYRAAGRGMRV